MKGEKFVLGVFDDEDVLLSGVKQVRGEGVKIYEVYSPFPVHGVGHALGYKRSKLSIAAFLFGLTGTGLAILMQTYMMGIDWPMVIGGKDFTPAPTFVPVTFELTVLLAALGMVATFLITNDLRPYGRAKVFDLRQTDDKHIVAINLKKNGGNRNEIERILKDSGATEVNDKTVAWAS